MAIVLYMMAMSQTVNWPYAYACRRPAQSVEVHPHMLRHACGFALADQGTDTRLIQDYLGC